MQVGLGKHKTEVNFNLELATEDVKVSVLVPIYNVEPYLKECLRSLTRQTLAEMEFICINDGSTDRSPKILARFAKRDHRFVVIDKENSGYGDSMNVGLARARGEYIGIVEPDDWVEPNTFADLYYLAKQEKAEVVRANYYRFTSERSELVQQVSAAEAAGEVRTARLDPHCLRQAPAIWSGLYSHDFLQRFQIQFLTTPGASYQDTGFFWKTLAAARRLAFTEQAFYHYRTDNANSSVKNAAKMDMVREEYHSIAEFLREHKLYDAYGPLMQATKFATYHWNLLRLDASLVDEFIPKMRQEFAEAWAADELHRVIFPLKHWLVLQLLLRSERLFRQEIKFYRWLKGHKPEQKSTEK